MKLLSKDFFLQDAVVVGTERKQNYFLTILFFFLL